jgi:hypothetical protein
MFNKLTDKEMFEIVKKLGTNDLEAIMHECFAHGMFEALRVFPTQRLTIRNQAVIWKNEELDAKQKEEKKEEVKEAEVSKKKDKKDKLVKPNYHMDEPIPT